MNALEPLYHNYELDNFEKTGTQNLQFIFKEPVGDSGELVTLADGTTNEELLEVLIHRLGGLNQKLPNQYTLNAVAYCAKALLELRARTAERTARRVEGTHKP